MTISNFEIAKLLGPLKSGILRHGGRKSDNWRLASSDISLYDKKKLSIRNGSIVLVIDGQIKDHYSVSSSNRFTTPPIKKK